MSFAVTVLEQQIAEEEHRKTEAEKIIEECDRRISELRESIEKLLEGKTAPGDWKVRAYEILIHPTKRIELEKQLKSEGFRFAQATVGRWLGDQLIKEDNPDGTLIKVGYGIYIRSDSPNIPEKEED